MTFSQKLSQKKYHIIHLYIKTNYMILIFIPVSYTHLDVYKRQLQNCADDPKEIAQIVAERTHSQVVQVIGKKIVLYKESKDNKKIELPKDNKKK